MEMMGRRPCILPTSKGYSARRMVIALTFESTATAAYEQGPNVVHTLSCYSRQ